MSLRSVLIVLMALVLGASAAVGVGKFLPEAPKADTVTVVVAVADLPRSKNLSADLLTTRECPKDLVPPGAITRLEDALDRKSFYPLVKGETLLDTKLAARGAKGAFGPEVAKGKRSISIPAPNGAISGPGFIEPGGRVDVFHTLRNQGASETSTGANMVPLVQNVRILAVNQRADAQAENKPDAKEEMRSVTLEVTPEEAAKLAWGQSTGVLNLTLRNPEDNQLVTAQQVEKPREAPPPPASVPPPVIIKAAPVPTPIRTLRGTSEDRVYFPTETATSDR